MWSNTFCQAHWGGGRLDLLDLGAQDWVSPCFPMANLLQSVLFWAWCSASSRGSSEMLLIWSFHLSGGRPRGLAVVKSLLYAWYGCREWGILATCPNQVNCRLLISWVMVLSIWSSRLMLTFLTLSHSLTPTIVLRHRIFKHFKFVFVYLSYCPRFWAVCRNW